MATESIPNFKPENISYQREEKQGYWTFIPRLFPETRELIINRTGREILELCDGSRNLSGIEDSMRERYPSASSELIKRDVRRTLSYYSTLWVVEWSGENPFLCAYEEPCGANLSMSVARDTDLVEIVTFVAEIAREEHGPGLRYCSPFFRPMEYTEVAVRQKLFSYSEEFFLLREAGQIRGMISVVMPDTKSNYAASIRLAQCPPGTEEPFFNYAIALAPRVAVTDIAKVSLYESCAQPLNHDLLQFLLKLGFCVEARLRQQLGPNEDLRILSWFYPPELIETIRQEKSRSLAG